ncbi:MAG TPA: hypothetical protein VF173_36465 [Thermoanaerobaculia bacterium]|nr:hypothetical protein [Thermoanaerobaculia bacterium]
MQPLKKCLPALGLGLAIWIAASVPARAVELYVLNPDGSFAAFDPQDGQIHSAWNLLASPLHGGEPVGGPAQGAVAAFPGGLCFAVPEAEPGAAAGDATAPIPYRVVSAELATMRRIAEWRLPQRLSAPPRLLFDRAGQRLLVEWQDAAAQGASRGASLVFRMAVLAVPGLAETARLVAAVPAGSPALPALTDGARFTPDGKAILDRDRIVRLAGGTFTASPVALATTPEQLARLERYSPARADHHPSYVLAAIDSDAGKVLYLARSERPEVKGDLVFTFDPATRSSTPPIDVPRCHAALLPDGRRIAVQEVEAPANRALSQTRTTGRLQVIDAVSGERLASLDSPLLAGGLENVRLRCVSPDGDTLIYRGGHAEVVVVELKNKKVWTPNVAFSADLEAQCAFVEN